MSSYFPVRCSLCLQQSDRTVTVSLHATEIDFTQRRRFVFDPDVWEYVMYEDRTVQYPQWKCITDPEKPNRVIGVVDGDAPATIERVRMLTVKEATSKNATVCPRCQRDPAVLHALQQRRMLASIHGGHSGLAEDTFTRDKNGKPAEPEKVFARKAGAT